MEGAGLWCQPSPCLPAKGCSTPAPSPVLPTCFLQWAGFKSALPLHAQALPGGPLCTWGSCPCRATRWPSSPLMLSVNQPCPGQLVCDRHCVGQTHLLWSEWTFPPQSPSERGSAQCFTMKHDVSLRCLSVL